MKRATSLALPLFCLLALFTTRAHADTITVGGTAVVTNSGVSPTGVALTASLSGPNFSAAGMMGNNGLFGVSPCSRTDGPCSSGSLNSNIGGSDLVGAFVLNGNTYSGGAVNQVTLFFQSGPFTIPAELLGASGVVVTAPFTLIGSASGGGDFVDFTAQGTATLFLARGTFGFDAFGNPRTGLFLDRLVYATGAVAPGVSVVATPEPATMLLMGSGLLGVLGAARRRRRNAEKDEL